MEETTTFEEKLRDVVFQSLGHASMCWKPRPTGIFDGEEVEKAGNNLIRDLKELFNDRATHQNN